MGRESGVEKQHGVLLLEALRQKKLESETALHRADCRNNAAARHVDVEERLDEFRTGLLQFRDTLDGGIFVGNTAFEGLDFGGNAHILGLESGITDFEVNHRFAGLALYLTGEGADLADRGRTEIHYHETLHDSVESFFAYGEHGCI